MKKLCIAVFLFALITSVTGSASADNSMNAFWDKFKAAVIKGDKEAVFAMSALPIGMSFGESTIRTKAQFMKSYRNIFADQVNAAKCFKASEKTLRVTSPFSASVIVSLAMAAPGFQMPS